jgi:hypothetical protein
MICREPAKGCCYRKRHLRQAGDTNPVTTDLLKTISIGFIDDGLILRIISELVEIIPVKSIEIYLHNVIIRP